jgi:hypothetical protein
MKRKHFILFYLSASFFLIFYALYGLAITYPFHPGHPLYAIQNVAEKGLITFQAGAAERALLHFELVERRLADLAMVARGENLAPAMAALDDALQDAIASIQSVSLAEETTLNRYLDNLLLRVDLVLSGLAKTSDPQALQALETRVSSLRQASVTAQVAEETATTNSSKLSESLIIPFLNRQVDHGEFLMSGAHARTGCLNCHESGSYAGTPSTCESCHALTQEDLAGAYDLLNPKYAAHFSGDCADCHNAVSWEPVTFDHREVWECSSCHTQDLPSLAAIRWLTSRLADVNINRLNNNPGLVGNMPMDDFLDKPVDRHYPGDCGLCHTDTTNWAVWNYDHNLDLILAEDKFQDGVVTIGKPTQTGSKNCSDCHTVSKNPLAAGHQTKYESDCLNCHRDETSWAIISFNHAGYTDCSTCHVAEKPTHHYPGECSTCHTTENWTSIVYVHSETSACQVCHLEPSHHYPGECNDCHTSTNWYDSIYEHVPGSDCLTCHTAPADHAAGQCSDCHSTVSWTDDAIYHALQTCDSCHTKPADHYSGMCYQCHTTQKWTDNTIYHALTTCAACHAQPSGHYPGSCALCHQTIDWTVGKVDHSELSACSTCHKLDELLGSHYPGECSNCHNTEDWKEAIFSHKDLTACATCHKTPPMHYQGECINCHISTSDWFTLEFDHTNQNYCLDCHIAPAEHYPGTCSLCHVTDNWEETQYTHLSSDKCTSCHTAPGGHWPGQCSNCHVTSTWEVTVFDHTIYTDCKSCHVRPANHPRGQCSNCHTTESWTIVTTKTPTPTETEVTPEPSETPTPTETEGTPEPSETSTPEP